MVNIPSNPVTYMRVIERVFSVTPFKINQNQNRSINKVQNMGNERRYIYKDPRQDAGQKNISYTRYPKKCFTQTMGNRKTGLSIIYAQTSGGVGGGGAHVHQRKMSTHALQKNDT